jgi:hypothetical protein
MNAPFSNVSSRPAKNAFTPVLPVQRSKPTTMNRLLPYSTMRPIAAALAGLALCAPLAGQAADTTPEQQLARFNAQAAAAGQAERGRAWFTARHGGEWSCASCHGQPPTAAGKHAGTGKPIAPLAPASNAKAFTDTARVDKWFRRNCNDVLKRECSADEKADLLAYLIGLKP